MTRKRTPTQPKTYRHFAVGTVVASQDAWTGEIHTGTVTRVNILSNGYPQTFADFPTKGGEREWHVDGLRTPEALERLIAERNELFPNNWLR